MKQTSFSRARLPTQTQKSSAPKLVLLMPSGSRVLVSGCPFAVSHDTSFKPHYKLQLVLADHLFVCVAAPEIINCRLAMLGFAAAVVVELTTGKNVIQQSEAAPVPIALISLLFVVASIIPIVRGVPRRGNSIFTADAELWNGRLVSLSKFCCASWFPLLLAGPVLRISTRTLGHSRLSCQSTALAASSWSVCRLCWELQLFSGMHGSVAVEV